MTEAIGTETFKGVISLYKLIQSFRHHPKHVRDLTQGLEDLQGVLRPLTETVSADIGIDLSALEIPLQRCNNACKEFEQEILKCLLRSGGDRTSFRDWAKLRYMGDDIDGFRRQLSGYQLTICVALADANLRKSSLTAEELDGYQRLLIAATDDLQAHLQSMEEKLQVIFEHTVAETDEDATELRRIKEEHLSTEKGLEICAQLSDHIDQIQVTSKLNSRLHGSNEPGALPERVVNESLQECKHNLTMASSKLETHMRDTIHRMVAKSKMAMTSKEEIADLARIWDELETTFKRKDMFSKAESRLNENISVIENHGNGDARQIMVSTDGKTLHGKNSGSGWRSFQVGGSMSEAALQDVVRSMSSLCDQRPDNDNPSIRNNTPTAMDKVDNGKIAKFRDQYGPGFQLSPTSTLDEAEDSIGMAKRGSPTDGH
ncbi:hypothetical protein V491_05656 [Pseudogymnoascus sp. VKM F-3775]|nr:hypothetical protein V491_05656 [Pseudogymnoascus sp. VKM F-3775]